MDLKTPKGVKRLGIVLIALLLIAGIFLVIMPLIKQHADYQEQIDAAQSEENTVALQLSQTQRQTASIGEVVAFDTELSKAFPGAADTPGLIAFVGKAASDSGMKPDSIRELTATIPQVVAPSNPSDGIPGSVPPPPTGAEAGPAVDPAAPTPDTVASSNTAEVSVTLTIEASPDQISAFVKNILSSEKNTFILNYTVSTVENEPSTANMTIKTYIYNPIPPVTIDNAPGEDGTITDTDDEVSVPLPDITNP